MGGHAAGEVASELAIDYLAELMPRRPDADKIEGALIALHARLLELALLEPELNGMGTTIVGAIRNENVVTGFNIGDSRLYRLRAGRLEQMSKDHACGHMLTQCLGGNDHSSPRPHILSWTHSEGDMLLLCSDGLTNLVSDDRIGSLLSGKNKDPANVLVTEALENGGTDNVSVIIAR